MAFRRIAAVTLTIAALGAVVGAVLGAALLDVWALLIGANGRNLLSASLIGGGAGAALGAVLAPVTGWLFLRRVPLGRALARTALGTTIGAAGGLIVERIVAAPVPSPFTVLFGALLGFLAAVVWLRIATRASKTAPAADSARSPLER